jgi:hypothetical protein
MLRPKTMLLTVVVVALAVPSLWAQKERLVRPKAAPDGSAACVAAPVGLPPAGYYASTNKCSSGNVNYGKPNSRQTFVQHCSDSGGVEARYDQGLIVNAVSPGGTWPISWGASAAPFNVESVSPDIYGNSVNIATEIDLKLSHVQGVLGLEASNLTVQTFTVTFHTTAGDVSVGATSVGGSSEPDPGAQRFVAICSGPAITGVTVNCDSCTDTNGDGANAIAQIRGDKFKGF